MYAGTVNLEIDGARSGAIRRSSSMFGSAAAIGSTLLLAAVPNNEPACGADEAAAKRHRLLVVLGRHSVAVSGQAAATHAPRSRTMAATYTSSRNASTAPSGP